MEFHWRKKSSNDVIANPNEVRVKQSRDCFVVRHFCRTPRNDSGARSDFIGAATICQMSLPTDGRAYRQAGGQARPDPIFANGIKNLKLIIRVNSCLFVVDLIRG